MLAKLQKQEPSYDVGRKVNWCSHYGKKIESFIKKTELPYDPAIPPLGIFPNKTNKTNKQKKIDLERYIPLIFTAVLFRVAKIWKQPKNLLIDEWIKYI